MLAQLRRRGEIDAPDGHTVGSGQRNPDCARGRVGVRVVDGDALAVGCGEGLGGYLDAFVAGFERVLVYAHVADWF